MHANNGPGEENAQASTTPNEGTVARARAEAAMRSSEEKFRSLFEVMDEGCCLCEVIRDDSGAFVSYRFLALNPAFTRLTGIQAKQVVGREVYEFIPDFNQYWLEQYKSVVETGQPARFEAFIPQFGRWFGITGFPYDGDLFAALFDDITERKQRETTLRESLSESQAELHALTQRLLVVQEQDRLNIAQDLHDSLGQRAALVGLETGQLERIVDSLPDAAKPILHRLRGHITDLSREIHEVSRELHPAIILDLGLPAALAALVEEHRKAGVDVAVKLSPCPPLPIETATAMYRIAQEALSNAAHHAPGSAVTVSLVCPKHESALVLTIEDTGPGFDLEAARSKGRLGLIGMQQRARVLGGTLRIETASGEGTRVIAHVPLDPHAA